MRDRTSIVTLPEQHRSVLWHEQLCSQGLPAMVCSGRRAPKGGDLAAHKHHWWPPSCSQNDPKCVKRDSHAQMSTPVMLTLELRSSGCSMTPGNWSRHFASRHSACPSWRRGPQLSAGAYNCAWHVSLKHDRHEEGCMTGWASILDICCPNQCSCCHQPAQPDIP